MSYLTPEDELYARFRVAGYDPEMSARFAGYGEHSKSRSAMNEVSRVVRARIGEMRDEIESAPQMRLAKSMVVR